MLQVISLETPVIVDLTAGDTLRILISFGYRGPETRLTLYTSIGNISLFGFDEIVSVQKAIDLPESLESYTTREESIDITISQSISAGTGYDLMAKIKEYQSQTEIRVNDVINITGTPSPWAGLTSVMMMAMLMSIMGQVMPQEQG